MRKFSHIYILMCELRQYIKEKNCFLDLNIADKEDSDPLSYASYNVKIKGSCYELLKNLYRYELDCGIEINRFIVNFEEIKLLKRFEYDLIPSKSDFINNSKL